MGYSAGGHLALLYAYKAAKCAGCTYKDNCGGGDQANENCPYDKYKVSPAIPIKLVISEAGPTYFALSKEDLNPICNNYIQAMVGSSDTKALYDASPLTYVDANAPYTILVYGNGVTAKYGNNYIQAMVGSSDTKALYDASPLTYASAASPYTILMYGGTDFDENDIIDSGSDDTVVPYFQGETLHKCLSPEGQTTKSSLFSFEYPYTHNSFGEDDGSDGDFMDSINPKNPNFSGYYTKIKDELARL